jgi:light-regulated signal transduction histidine kinase (bacteriophytochrome)
MVTKHHDAIRLTLPAQPRPREYASLPPRKNLGPRLARNRLAELGDSLAQVETSNRGALRTAGLKALVERNEVVLTSRSLPQVMGDAHELIELFQHLLANVIKRRAAARRRILISAPQRGEEWQIAVGDDALGIDAQGLDRLFRVSQRPHGAPGNAGTGSGLVRCNQIVERNGGRLWALSTRDGAQRFISLSRW